MACCTASKVVELSWASFCGLRNGTAAPHSFDTSAISLLSVVTITSSQYLDCKAASMLHAIKGLPHSILMFLPGSPLLPPRAGMIARNDLLLNIFQFLEAFPVFIPLTNIEPAAPVGVDSDPGGVGRLYFPDKPVHIKALSVFNELEDGRIENVRARVDEQVELGLLVYFVEHAIVHAEHAVRHDNFFVGADDGHDVVVLMMPQMEIVVIAFEDRVAVRYDERLLDDVS